MNQGTDTPTAAIVQGLLADEHAVAAFWRSRTVAVVAAVGIIGFWVGVLSRLEGTTAVLTVSMLVLTTVWLTGLGAIGYQAHASSQRRHAAIAAQFALVGLAVDEPDAALKRLL